MTIDRNIVTIELSSDQHDNIAYWVAERRRYLSDALTNPPFQNIYFKIEGCYKFMVSQLSYPNMIAFSLIDFDERSYGFTALYNITIDKSDFYRVDLNLLKVHPETHSNMVAHSNGVVLKAVWAWLSFITYIKFAKEEANCLYALEQAFKDDNPQHRVRVGSYYEPNVTYIVTDVKPQEKPKGHHSSPSYAFSVRGHYRHYKSGKTVWIAQHKRGVGEPVEHTYRIKNFIP